MVKEKIFTPKDFDKPSDSKGGLLKKVFIGIAAVAVIGLVIWGISSINKTNDEVPTEGGVLTPEGVVTEPNDSIETDSVIEFVVEEPVAETTEKKAEPTVKEETSKPTHQVSGDVEKEAMNVIRGNYGNNPQRQQKLGASYQSIQDRVNQLKKEGVF